MKKIGDRTETQRKVVQELRGHWTLAESPAT